MYVIGKGGYGKVYKVKDKITHRYYALKQMTKVKILEERSEENILNERMILAKMHSHFIVSLLYAFQNQNNLFLVMELLTGGDLRYHLLNYRFVFTETQLKFLLTNIILGLEYIHKKGIVHRDIKPENIIFNIQGYLKISDFGISNYLKKLDKSDDSGTPAYMAPETIKGQDQDYSVDYYSLGVIGYEIMKGSVPYDSNDRDEIKKMMKNGDIVLDSGEKLKTRYSPFCLDFISKLLRQNPKERLGSKNGEHEIKQHSFFTGIDWKKIKKLKFKSPIYDIIKYSRMKNGYADELFDFEYCNHEDDITPRKAKFYINFSKSFNIDLYFKYYTCVCVKNIIRELKQDEKENKKRYEKSNKRLRKSQSTHNIDLPYIVNNPTDIYYQNIPENYYESKLLKYKHNLAKLKYDYLVKKDQLKQMKYPFNFNFNKNNKNNNFFQNYNKLPDPSYLPLIDLNKNNYINNFMPPFMNPDQNNFFAKNKRKNNMFSNNNYEYEDDDSDYLSDDIDEEYIYPFFNDSNYLFNIDDNNYYNPFWYNQSMIGRNNMENKRIKRNKKRYHTKRKSKLIKNETSKEEH